MYLWYITLYAICDSVLILLVWTTCYHIIHIHVLHGFDGDIHVPLYFPRGDIKPWNLCCPMPKAEGDITFQGFSFTEEQILYCHQRKQRRVQQSQWLWALDKICDADIVNFGERWRAGNLLNTLQNNSMYMHWEIRINYSEMLLNLYFTGRNVVFTDRNGVSLSGEVCLNHTDVPQVWLMVCFIVVWLMVCFIVYHGEFAVVLRHNLFMLICCCSVLFKEIL